MRGLTLLWFVALMGCGGSEDPSIATCDEATKLCEECEMDPTSCEELFRGASEEFCQSASDTYEASCNQ